MSSDRCVAAGQSPVDKERPYLSVLLPVRNGMPWLPTAVGSIWRQTFRDFELIVLEDGSTDATSAWLETQSDARLRVISTRGIGIARALNRGLAAARGIYVARHDADDESLSLRFECQVAMLDSRADVDVVATVADYIDAAGNPIDDEWVRTVRRQQDVAITPEAIATLMPLTCCVTHGSIMARAAVITAAGGYRPEFMPADDYDLWLRLLPRHRFMKIAAPLYRYRIHHAQLGATSRQAQIRNSVLAKLQYVRRQYPELPMPARLAVVGETRGDEIYRSAAVEVGFQPTDADRAWDVLAVTDFAKVDDYHRRFTDDGVQAAGNLFVRLQ
jgi:glycosyltransferase involved in cell wall biosynthesis